MGPVIHLSKSEAGDHKLIRERLRAIVAVFEHIETEELLSALPDCPLARRNHLVALDLLLGAEAELRDLLSEPSS